MDLSKIRDYIDLEKMDSKVCIVGCGSVGSWLAVQLARCGVKNFRLYDFDKVEEKNIANQAFEYSDIGKLKTECLYSKLIAINPNVMVRTFNTGWTPGTRLAGVVFLAVDNIDLRRQIVEENKTNTAINAFIDIRTSLESADIYASPTGDASRMNNFIQSMNYHAEDVHETRSACGGVLGCISTVTLATAYAVSEYINFMKNGSLKKTINVYSFSGYTESF